MYYISKKDPTFILLHPLSTLIPLLIALLIPPIVIPILPIALLHLGHSVPLHHAWLVRGLRQDWHWLCSWWRVVSHRAGCGGLLLHYWHHLLDIIFLVL